MDLEGRRPIIQRTLGLCALIARGHMEPAADDPKIQEMHEVVLRWAVDVGAGEGLERDEGLILVSPLGRLTRAETARALFRAEQLAILAWALGLVPLIRHDDHPHDRFLAHRVGFLKPGAVRRLERTTTHTREHLLAYARRAAALLDRLKRFAIDGRPVDFADEYGEYGEYGVRGVPLIGGDLAIGNLPLAAAPEVEWKLALAAAVERDEAARWLLAPASAVVRPPIDA